MTDRRDLKRRVRERQARTGESYMTALRHVQGQGQGQGPRATAIPTIELVDLTGHGQPLGFKCRIAAFPRVVERLDVTAMLVRLRDALLATEGDRAFALMRTVALRGERVRIPVTMEALAEAARFVERARIGIGGISDGGIMLAMHVEASGGGAAEARGGRRGPAALEMVLFTLQLTPDFVPVHRDPTLVISMTDEVLFEDRLTDLIKRRGEAP